jgi:hypothetical protein
MDRSFTQNYLHPLVPAKFVFAFVVVIPAGDLLLSSSAHLNLVISTEVFALFAKTQWRDRSIHHRPHGLTRKAAP